MIQGGENVRYYKEGKGYDCARLLPLGSDEDAEEDESRD